MTGVASADEADDASRAIVAHIQERWASATSQQDQRRIAAVMRYITKTVYYPTSTRDLQRAAVAAVDAVDSPRETTMLVEAAMAGIVDSLGHGAHLLMTLGGDGPTESAGSLQSRQSGSLWVVPLPSMSVVNSSSTHTCADLIRYVGQPSDGVTGIVLDLRGNEGGPLTDSSCLASLFLKKGQPLFQVIGKQGKPARYESEPAGGSPLDLPIAVLLDNRTDSGGLLVAAILQDHKRATLIGEVKAAINGAVCSLVFPLGANRGIILPTAEILLPDKRPLAAGVRVDVTMSAHDDNALMNVARTYVAKR
jgi:hypothetical protein